MSYVDMAKTISATTSPRTTKKAPSLPYSQTHILCSYSKLLSEHFVIDKDLTVIFESNTCYTKTECERLVGSSPKSKQTIHHIKSLFEGELVDNRWVKPKHIKPYKRSKPLNDLGKNSEEKNNGQISIF